ncbi:hypothetical protein [Enterobacter cloacae complex sp. 356H4]|uniref:hypothetical protein n=1 Tax=Enterobacter cloacae complex sp. 356H4 TaxID=3395836 RepID=UPI003CEA1CFF
MIELASEVVNFIVNKIGLIFSLAALVLSFLSYRNSKLIRRATKMLFINLRRKPYEGAGI